MSDLATENVQLREALAALLAIERPYFSSDEIRARELAKEAMKAAGK